MTRKHNYRKKIQELAKENRLPSKSGVYILHIFHDPGCKFLQGGDCDCNPDLELQHIDPKDKDQL